MPGLRRTPREGRSPRHGVGARRLGAATLAGLVALTAILVAGGSAPLAVTGSWCAGAGVFLAWVWLTIAPKDAAETATWAQADDFSHATADLVLLSACVASLVAVGYALVVAGNDTGAAKWVLIALSVASIALAWWTVQTIYTVRYGDLYYGKPVGGIDFNEDDPPDYGDFAYLALTIGMTFQVSDTDLQSKPIRRTAVRHALLSYLFGAVIIAVTINVVAGLLH